MAKMKWGKYESVATPYKYYVDKLLYSQATSSEARGVYTGMYSVMTRSLVDGRPQFSAPLTNNNLNLAINVYAGQLIYGQGNGGTFFFNTYTLSGTSYVGDHHIYTSLFEQYQIVETTDYNYSKSTFIENVTAEANTYPANARHTDGFWYVLLGTATNASVNVNGIYREAEQFVNVNGVYREVETSMNVEGIYRQ